jgi:DNA mismatch repair protein MutH
MALIVGDQTADTGMSKAIYDQLQAMLEPVSGELSAETRSQLRESWKKLAYAIARGVIEHIMANMEVVGIQTQGNVNASVLVFTQSNDGTGHIK